MNRKLKAIFLIGIIVLLGLTLAGCGGGGADSGSLTVAAPAEWVEREDGMRPFQEHYGFEFDNVVEVELGLAYSAVNQGDALIGVGDATEGRIIQYNLKVLEDDLSFFPAYNATPTIRLEVLEENPEIEDIMKEVSSLLDLETQTELNLKIAIEGEDPEDVARNFLEEKGLLTGEKVEGAGRIVVSSKTFAEALTQGYLTLYLLEDRGFDVVDEVGLGEVAVIRPALESGQIDIYWEYTGTGLMNVMGYDKVPGSPKECYQIIHDYDLEENNIKWLDMAPANNTFVLFISEETHAEYGWESLSQVAKYANSKSQ